MATSPEGRAEVSVSPGRTTTPSGGFRARLHANLWDLVQMECQARSRQVVRVASAGNVGYLYFADGQIFHAQTQHAHRMNLHHAGPTRWI